MFLKRNVVSLLTMHGDSERKQKTLIVNIKRKQQLWYRHDTQLV